MLNLILIAILPVFFIGYFLYKIDCDKEPTKLLVKLLFFGVCSCFPAIYLSTILGWLFPPEEEMNLVTLFFYVLISIAFVEELCKFVFTYIGSYNHDAFNNLYDMIIYATFVSLGFALFENIIYVFDGGLVVGIIRALLAVPGHACDGIVMGYYLGLSKISYYNKNKNLMIKNMVLGLVLPVLMHTFYDYCLFANSVLLLILLLGYVLFIYIFLYNRIRHISRYSKDFKSKANFCIKCGYKIIGKYCAVCGHCHTNK